MSEGESVKVAVRCRPFNQREKDRNAVLIIKMTDQLTEITNPADGDVKKFSFDFSYWSHDGFEEKENGYLEAAGGSKYSSQRVVFEDLGQGVLNNAVKGFNCSLFAYGQTGSGKSYSMVGYGNNKGIVPITCDELFKMIEGSTDANMRYEVLFSMLEIYNEQVRDLLSSENHKGGLPVRQHPKLGFYVDGLKKTPVGSYADIERRMEQGTNNRTVAATQMNATSSRAHTVVTIVFDQIEKTDRGETKKSSTMNLVDLAGSERADSTGATGDRLKEGANINKSLSALGNVISALADLSMGKKKVMVPYRDSVLTKLLQNALGGNSKTIMIAALSPADINYDETLSTLRYADRAKKIKNKAVVNENPLDKLIRELREENERLKAAMSGELPLAVETKGMTPEEIDKMRKDMEADIRAQMVANMEMLEGNSGNFEEKLSAAREEVAAEAPRTDTRKTTIPHIVNLNEDPMLSGVIFQFFDQEQTTVGRSDADPKPDIPLKGLSISKEHAIITKQENNVVEIKPGSQGTKTKINGLPLTGTRDLHHKDRIMFGSNHLYVFYNPLNEETSEDAPDTVDWEFAQKEIAEAKGFSTGSASGLTKDQQIAQEQIIEILPMVTEANAVSEELDKRRSFEVVLISAAAQEGVYGEDRGTKVMVKMKNMQNDNTWLWERGKFMNRRFMMQEMYQRFLDGEDVSQIPQEEDPFWEPPEDLLIGTTNVFLQALSYCLDFDDKLSVTDYKGSEEGFLYVTVTPCDERGKPLDEENFVDEPVELLDKPYSFKIYVRRLEVLNSRYNKGLKVRYQVYRDEKPIETPMIFDTLEPEFKHSKIITFDKMTQDHLDFFENGCITFSVYAKQVDVLDPKYSKMSTKELNEMNAIEAPAREAVSIQPKSENAAEVGRIKSELSTMQRKNERLEDKERRLKQLLDDWANKKPEEKDMESFYRAVNNIARGSANKFKTQAEVITKLLRMQRLGRGAFDFDSKPAVNLKKASIPNGDVKNACEEPDKKTSISQDSAGSKRNSVSFKDSGKNVPNDDKPVANGSLGKDTKKENVDSKNGSKGSSACQIL